MASNNNKPKKFSIGGGVGSNTEKRVNLCRLLLGLQAAYETTFMNKPRATIFPNRPKPVIIKADQTALIEAAEKKRLSKREKRKLEWEGVR